MASNQKKHATNVEYKQVTVLYGMERSRVYNIWTLPQLCAETPGCRAWSFGSNDEGKGLCLAYTHTNCEAIFYIVEIRIWVLG